MVMKLSDECVRIVSSWRCNVGDVNENGFVAIYDEDDEFLMWVEYGVPGKYLNEMFKYGASQFVRGKTRGVEESKAKIREALGLGEGL